MFSWREERCREQVMLRAPDIGLGLYESAESRLLGISTIHKAWVGGVLRRDITRRRVYNYCLPADTT